MTKCDHFEFQDVCLHKKERLDYLSHCEGLKMGTTFATHFII
jgi:hypothetical protein